MKTIVVEIAGGCLQAVYTDLPEDMKIEVRLMDKDNRDVDPDGSDAKVYDECKALIESKSVRSIF